MIDLGVVVSPGSELNGQGSEDGEEAPDRGHDNVVTWEREKEDAYSLSETHENIPTYSTHEQRQICRQVTCQIHLPK